MTSAPGELVAAGDPAAHVLAVVDEELEVQLRRTLAGVAVAGRRLVDAPEASPKGDVGGLDRVEEEGSLGPPVLDAQERGVALELRQPERRLQAPDDRLEQVARDRRRVLDLAPGEIRGVAGDVGDDQEAGLGCRCHVRQARPWSRSNVNTRIAT